MLIRGLRLLSFQILIQDLTTCSAAINSTDTRVSASDFFDCSDLIDIRAVDVAFDNYCARNPGVTRQNVNSTIGQPFRDQLMLCPSVCLLPFGKTNDDITGIGVS